MARILFYAIVFYLLYRLIFDLIIPVYKTTKSVRRQFSRMQDEAARQTESPPPGPSAKPAPEKPVAGEYIDFEEIRN